MIGILIIAHGNLGDSLIHCASHVMGVRPTQLEFLGVEIQHDPAHLLPQALHLVQTLDTGDGVLVLSDIYGATPCNLVRALIQSDHVEGVAGANLPMLVRVLTYRNKSLALDDLVEKAVSGGREGVVRFDEDSCEHYQAQL